MHAMDNTTEKRTIQKKNRNFNNTDIYFIFKKLACNYICTTDTDTKITNSTPHIILT